MQPTVTTAAPRRVPSAVSRRQLLRQQRRWAEASGLAVDGHGFVRAVEQNLCAPFSTQARLAFEHSGIAELEPRGLQPAKLRALHSSAALVVNVFDHWTERDRTPLQRALALEAGIVSVSFEQRFATGLPGKAPNLDVALELASGHVVGIESKFTEWLTPKRPRREPFKHKYFDGGAVHWTARGLPRCQRLAEDLMRGALRYRHLDAAQLLKQALGLAAQRPGRCTLRYVFLDVRCAQSARHRAELEHFARCVDESLAFSAEPYQALIGRLSEHAAHANARGEHDDYFRYLGERYCGTSLTRPR